MEGDHFLSDRAEAEYTAQRAAAQEAATAQTRLVSLDALRGFDMIWITGFDKIIFALATASGLPLLKRFLVQLEHGPWIPGTGRLAAGFHLYDMIMPLFLFCAGASMPFSFARRVQRGESVGSIYGHVALRFAILFLLGMIHQGHLLEFDLSKLHLYCNTLQAIAAGSVVAALLLYFPPAAQLLATAGLIAGYWALMTFVPGPGATPGVLDPQHNLAIFIDKKLLGHFQDQTYYTWILTSMVFGATVMLGALAGQWLKSFKSHRAKFIGLLVAGVALIAGGLGWSLSSPIVKYIWSSSFVLFSGGICLVLLALFYLVIDVWGWRRWAFPFVVIGSNAIVAYMVGQFIKFNDIAKSLIGGTAKWCGPWFPVAQAMAAFALLWLMLFVMYRKKIFIKV